MTSIGLQQLREQYLIKLYQLSEGGLHPEVDYWKVQSEVGVSREETTSIVDYLKSKDFVSFECRVPCIRITTSGIDEAERILAERYSQKEHRVLAAIADMARMSNLVVYQDLAKRLEMPNGELGPICNGLDEQGRIDFPGGDIIQMKPAGYRALESQEKTVTGGDTYNMYIGTLHGGAQQGSGNKQNIKITSEPVSKIIPELVALIEKVKSEAFKDKDDVLRDLEIAHQLATTNPDAIFTDAAWDRIKSKVFAAKTTMDVSGFVISTYPYWPQIIDFFQRHIR